MTDTMKCKNCGAPIAYQGGVVGGYWKHIRSVEMSSLWCYPKADQALQEFKFAAEPEESNASS